MTHFIVALLISISITISIGNARILNVPEEYETIQAGIDAHEAEDTILVQPGIYPENLVCTGSSVTIGSLTLLTNDRAYVDSTIIDGQQEGTVLNLRVTSRNSFINLRGFTIRNGLGNEDELTYAGGIFLSCYEANFTDLVVTDNRLGDIQSGFDAGGIFDGGSTYVTMTRVKVISNDKLGWFSASAYVELYDCEISRNRKGGAALIVGRLTIERSAFLNNTEGPGLDFGPGGSERNPLQLNRVTIAGTGGIGLKLYPGRANGVYVNATNCIISNNEGAEIALNEGAGPTATSLSISYSNVLNNEDEVDISGEVVQNWLEGNIDADPLFLDPENGDYHLTADSPCIDAGDPESPEDPDGTRADMGAFYYHPNRHPEVVAQIEDVIVDEDCDYVAIADLDTLFSDPDGDTLFYEYESLEPLGLTINEDNVLGLSPQENFCDDSLVVVVTARDREAETSQEFFVTILPVNDPPSVFFLLYPQDDSSFSYLDTVIFIWEQSFDPDDETPARFRLHLERWEWFTRTEIESLWVFDVGLETSMKIPDPAWEVTWPDYGCVSAPYTWWVEAIAGDDTTRSDSTYWFDVFGSGDVKERDNLSESFGLLSAFPNPFNSTTTISFSVRQASLPVKLAIYDISGRLVADLSGSTGVSAGQAIHPAAEGRATARSLQWNADNLPGGIYLIRLESGNEVRTIKAVLMK